MKDLALQIRYSRVCPTSAFGRVGSGVGRVTAEDSVNCVGDHDNSVHGACVLGQGAKLNRARGQGGIINFYRCRCNPKSNAPSTVLTKQLGV